MVFMMVAILLLLLTLTLLWFLKTVFTKTQQSTVEEQCKATVQREAQLNRISRVGLGHSAQTFANNVDCRQIPISLPGQDEKMLAGITGVYMEKCWNLFGRGASVLFSEGTGTFCHICYVLTFDPGTSFPLKESLQKQTLGSLKGKYDVPDTVVGERYGIIFRYDKSGQNVDQRIFVQPLAAITVCGAGTAFPRQRLA